MGNGWFSEDYVSGTPINRLNDDAQSAAAIDKAVASLRVLIEKTKQSVTIEEYLGDLQSEIDSLCADGERINPHNRQSIQQGVRHLRESILRAGSCPRDLTISQTHGDFQAANILVNQSGVWLIDWENSKVRQSGYDLLVLATESRQSTGLSRRLRSFSEAPSTASLLGQDSWPGLDWESSASRKCHIELFLLEEVAWHLRENCNNLFIRESNGLKQILSLIHI